MWERKLNENFYFSQTHVDIFCHIHVTQRLTSNRVKKPQQIGTI